MSPAGPALTKNLCGTNTDARSLCGLLANVLFDIGKDDKIMLTSDETVCNCERIDRFRETTDGKTKRGDD